jgi:hypothetical protein
MTGTDTATYLREQPGMSAFALEDGAVYYTYSAYARGLDAGGREYSKRPNAWRLRVSDGLDEVRLADLRDAPGEVECTEEEAVPSLPFSKEVRRRMVTDRGNDQHRRSRSDSRSSGHSRRRLGSSEAVAGRESLARDGEARR